MLGKRFTALLAIAMLFAFAICFLPDSAFAQRASASASVDNAGPALPAALPDAAPAPQDVTGTPVQADAIVNGAQADNCQKSVSRASARSVTAQANTGGGSAGVTRSSSNSVTVQRGGGLFSGLVARIAERRAHRHSTIASAAQARAANSASTTVTRQRTVTRLSGGSLSRAAGGAAGGSAAGGGSGAGNASAHAEAHATGN